MLKIKSTVFEMMNAFMGLLVNMAEERLSDFEDMPIETWKNEKEKRLKKTKQNKTKNRKSKNCRTTMKGVMWIMEKPEEERERNRSNIWSDTDREFP